MVKFSVYPNSAYHFVRWVVTGYTYFTSTAEDLSFVLDGSYVVTAECVVNGGAGGSGGSGGGGGGGVVYKSSHSLAAGTYNVTVGSGGAKGTTSNASNGGNSVFDTITAYGGGAGGIGSRTRRRRNADASKWPPGWTWRR